MIDRATPPTFGDAFCLTLLTSDPVVAANADAAGVDRIGLDFERLGKAKRQADVNGRVSDHTWDELTSIARSLVHADLFLRLDPLHDNTRDDVERALEAGVRVLMLPFFRTAEEVDGFTRAVRGRAKAVILLETAAAAVRIQDILTVQGVDEVMFGLNDLRLQFGVANHFEVLASPVIEALAAEVRRAGLPLAIGGWLETTTYPSPFRHNSSMRSSCGWGRQELGCHDHSSSGFNLIGICGKRYKICGNSSRFGRMPHPKNCRGRAVNWLNEPVDLRCAHCDEVSAWRDRWSLSIDHCTLSSAIWLPI
jgi:hypothetical protein